MILEILVSTMNRKDTSFLNRMFINNTINDYSILIINQTTEDNLLESELKNVRIINSFEKGLSRSRNLGIRHAIGDICLIADDDIIYKRGFEKDIIMAFNNHPQADFITFQMEDDSGRLFKAYPNVEWHNKKSIITVNSVVIAFRRENILKSGISFNPHFGLGAEFPTADEYIFLRDALQHSLKIYFEKTIILSHKYFSSGRVMGTDKMIYARSAVIFKYSGILTYLKLVKYLYQAFMAKEIKLNEFVSKYLVGIKGIYRYQELKKGIQK
ncbi:glycosyltransferase family 2 protein [Aestuariivivens sediminis]|uniref:glycosyltransferase family 2 protein n=1 Tax=Aestuariivivens sediminis TaxID=2913557 RepID=UPI001F595EFC|nr:glycosyltransferase family 2 protein [Aestuariivivens sediminis]